VEQRPPDQTAGAQQQRRQWLGRNVLLLGL
jgi:hypothetical protein